MIKRIDQLPAVLTSFAYREEYFPELEGMIVSVREHHPDWWLVTGKGPLENSSHPALEVESPRGKFQWHLPVSFQLDGSENDWLRIVLMKGWWMVQVWNNFGPQDNSGIHRVVWLDADARFNGPLDVFLDPQNEVVAAPWDADPRRIDPDDPEKAAHLCSGLAIFQGKRDGIVSKMLDQWSAACLASIQLPPAPSPYGPWPEGDQDLITTILKERLKSHCDYELVKLDADKYCGVPNYKSGAPPEGALVAQWMMNEKMRLPEDRNKDWPPPERARRAEAGLRPQESCTSPPWRNQQ